MRKLVTKEYIERRIFIIRDMKVMVDRDLAELYQVSTKRLNEQVKRNRRRFPTDFMFKLSRLETNELVANCDRFMSLKHSIVTPQVFSEQGVAMLSSVLNSSRAVSVNIQIMRAFVSLRQAMISQKELALRIGLLEEKYKDHDGQFKVVFDVIKSLIEPVQDTPKGKMGFHP